MSDSQPAHSAISNKAKGMEMATGDLVFVDVETTGLDWHKHVAIEIAYQTIDMDEPQVIYPFTWHPYFLTEFRDRWPWTSADPEAMGINKFYERIAAKPEGAVYAAPPEELKKFWDVLDGSTIVGANIRFDARMIERIFELRVVGDGRYEPWHHRLFDIEPYAAGIFGWPKLKGWTTICQEITKRREIFEFAGVQSPAFDATLNDHSAAGDTQTVKDAYLWLSWYSRHKTNIYEGYVIEQGTSE